MLQHETDFKNQVHVLLEHLHTFTIALAALEKSQDLTSRPQQHISCIIQMLKQDFNRAYKQISRKTLSTSCLNTRVEGDVPNVVKVSVTAYHM